MPEVNTQVTLYFGDSEETSGKAFTNERTEQSRNSELMHDPRKRGLSTKHQKKLLLHDDKTGYVSDSGTVSIVIDDMYGMTFHTPLRIDVLAKENIQFEAPLVHFYTPVNLGLYSTNGKSVPWDDENIRPVASMDFGGPVVDMYSQYGKAELKFVSSKNVIPSMVKSSKINAGITGQPGQTTGGMAFAGTPSQSASATGMSATIAVLGGMAATAANISGAVPNGMTYQSTVGGGSSMVGLKIGGKVSPFSLRKQSGKKKVKEENPHPIAW